MIGSGHIRTMRRWPLLSFSLLFTIAVTFSLRTEAQSLDAEERIMLRLITDDRAQNGLGQLSSSIALTRAAESLGISVRTLQRKLKAWGMEKGEHQLSDGHFHSAGQHVSSH